MNFVNSSLARRGSKSRVGALGEVKILLLPALNYARASSSCFPRILGGRLTQEFRQMVQDYVVIAKDGGLNVIPPNKLDDLLGMELFKIVK